MAARTRRLRGAFTYANVMATIAVFIALGGTSFAAAIVISGRNVTDASLTGIDVKNESLTGADVKGLGSADVRDGSLGTVDLSSTAVASLRGAKGDPGTNGTNGSPDTAAQVLAKLVTVDGAGSGVDADALDGLSSADLKPACGAGWGFFGGMCWELTDVSGLTYAAAAVRCANLGGRLPSYAEMLGVGQIAGTGINTLYDWASDVTADDSAVYINSTSGTNRDGERLQTTSSYARCVKAPTNALGTP
jgi:uncharacterized protein YjbI with pentapeptide repeats